MIAAMLGGITFGAPLALLALAALPLLWWLLRVTPPTPRLQVFPAIRLLANLRAAEETPARTPWWLLALRILAAGLVILGLARPTLDAAPEAAGGAEGALLLVLDDGWAAAPDWAARTQAAASVLDGAERAGRRVVLLTTARTEGDQPPRATAPLPAPELRARLAALRPKPWPSDFAAAAEGLAPGGAQGGIGAVSYLSDGIAGPGRDAFAAALARLSSVEEWRAELSPVRLLLPPRLEADRLVARVTIPPGPAPTTAAVLAQTGDGRTLARSQAEIPAGADGTDLAVVLPPELRNRLARLVLDGPPGAGGVALLDERWRRRPVGLLSADSGADTPLIGSLFYVRQALAPTTELQEGDLASQLARSTSLLVLADRPVDGAEREALLHWVEAGGVLVRFAGPRLAEAGGETDPLLPVRLLAGDRQLGGALSWSQPAPLAPFPAASPFAGLPIPQEVLVSRQVLAEPSVQLAERSWALLADGTPLVTAAPRGAGRVVLFHVTANADWSNLPLSGLFVEMLRRLVELSVGVAGPAPGPLPPLEALDGFGTLGAPPQAAAALEPGPLPPASPRHPPGYYGTDLARRATSLGSTVAPELRPAPPVPGATVRALSGSIRETPIGPWLVAIAVALLCLDLLLSLKLRGLLRGRSVPPRRFAKAATSAFLVAAFSAAGPALAADPPPALATRLAYVVTGDSTVDGVSRAGLAGLSDYVNRRTAASLAEPAAVVPGQDDLAFYPLLYWPVLADASLSGQAVAALNDFTARGGIILIDTRGSGNGEGFAPGADAALRRLAAGLAVPPLAQLTGDHVLARSFYLLQEFPGRYSGGAVWVGRDQDRSNDSVSPVIIGGHDWAAAWAVDSGGRNPYATLPGGTRQRTLAYRFGVNLVMYALTGNYKGDQVHVPALLERLGQ